jgi:hypothetical protein
MGATKKDFEKLIQEYNHQMMIANLQYEALIYEQLDCDTRPKYNE